MESSLLVCGSLFGSRRGADRIRPSVRDSLRGPDDFLYQSTILPVLYRHVDFECAIKELSLLGITFDAQYISQLRQSLQTQQENRRRRRQARLNEDRARNQEWSLCVQAMDMDSEAHGEPPTDILEDP